MSEALERAAIRETQADEANDRKDVTSRMETRARAAVALRIAGASYQQIADAQQFADAATARRVVEATIAATVAPEDVDHLRQLTGMRLERLLQAVWPKALKEKDPDQLAYSRTALAIIDRHAKLFGVDAPQKVEVYTPDQQEKREWVQTMLLHVTEGDIETEAETIDAELVEDDRMG